MIEKLLGLSDKSILKKSTYYAYLFGAIMGVVAIVFAIGGLIFRLSDIYKGMLLAQQSNIAYLESLSKEMHDSRLLNISELYAINLNAITELSSDYIWLLVFIGFILISNFILFKKLRNRLLSIEKGDLVWKN